MRWRFWAMGLLCGVLNAHVVPRAELDDVTHVVACLVIVAVCGILAARWQEHVDRVDRWVAENELPAEFTELEDRCDDVRR